MISRTGLEALCAAICERTVLDFEALISDKPALLPENVSITEIRKFASSQKYVNSDLNAILDHIDRIYREEFKPFVEENLTEIIKGWNSKEARRARKRGRWDNLNDAMKYRCPLCGGFLRPGTKNKGSYGYIICSHCMLNVRIPKEVIKKCTISE